MKTPQERKQRRDERRRKIRNAITGVSRPLDEDDREAVAILIKRGAEILSDGEVTDEEKADLINLIRGVATARSNTIKAVNPGGPRPKEE
jgi:hypothetical protein